MVFICKLLYQAIVYISQMVLSTTKKCQSIQSITNNTCILGGPKKGGLVNMQGRNANLSNAITTRAPYCNCGMPLGCIAGLAYLRANNLMTMNPQCSGGVPHRMYRGCRSGSGSGSDYVSGSGSGSGSAPNNFTTIELSQIAGRTGDTWTLTMPENSLFITIPQDGVLNIARGQTLIVPSPLRLVNNGSINVDGTLTVNIGGQLVNHGIINHTSNNTLNINGVFQNNNTVINTGTVNVTSTGKIVNADNSTITNNGTFHNYGEIENNETLNNHGLINNHTGGKIVNADGQITVHANAILVNHVDGEIQNLSNADIVINKGGNMVNHSESNDFNNQGDVQSSGIVHGSINGNAIVKTASSGVTGSITLDAIATPTSANTWSVNSNATITSDQVLTISAGQTLIVAASQLLLNNGTINNQGTIVNNGTINNQSGSISTNGTFNYANNQSGHMFNSGNITNAASGIINNSFDSYFYNGIMSVINGGGIYNYGGSLTNNGVINNKLNGTIYNDRNSNVQAGSAEYYSVFNNTGIVMNKGGSIINVLSTINNTGIIDNLAVSFVKTQGDSHIFRYGGNITNSTGSINNNGGGNITINADTIFVNQQGSNIINYAIIAINQGATMTLANQSRYRNNPGSSLSINPGGTVNNGWIDTGNPENHNSIIVSTNSEYIQNGTFNGPPPLNYTPVSPSVPIPDPNAISITTIANPSGYYMTLSESTVIPEGHTLTLPESYTFVIPVGKTLTNNGTIIMTMGGIDNQGVFTNNGAVNINKRLIDQDLRINNIGTINNNGVFSNLGFDIYSTGIINNNVGGTITNTSVSQTNGGGNIYNNRGIVANSGNIIMNANTTFVADINKTNNNSGGTILIKAGSTLTIKYDFNNNAQSTLTINQGGTINNMTDNRFIVSTNSTYNNSGTLIGSGPIVS
jgi:hypothetical protein